MNKIDGGIDKCGKSFKRNSCKNKTKKRPFLTVKTDKIFEVKIKHCSSHNLLIYIIIVSVLSTYKIIFYMFFIKNFILNLIILSEKDLLSILK